jgi:hypothetical protein
VDHDAVLRDVIAWATDDANVRLVIVTGSSASSGSPAARDWRVLAREGVHASRRSR